MVGEGVLFECLLHPSIDRVLLVNRRPYGAKHPKLTECIVPDFLKLEEFTSQLTGYDACFYCAGVSSLGLSEAEYSQITYDITPDPLPAEIDCKDPKNAANAACKKK